MLVFFCEKCKRQNAQPQCDSCGRALSNPSIRYVWEDKRAAISDTARIGLIARVAGAALAVCVLVMLIIDYILNGNAAFTSFFKSTGIPLAAVTLAGGLFALGLLALTLQGQESVQYMLDPKGVFKRTWIEPTRLKCWSRMIRYDKAAFQYNREGKPFLLAHEEYLLWQDTARYRLAPRAGRISLYRPYAFLFMALYLPPHEFDGAADMVRTKLKGKG